ncbi:MAG: LPS export ABC transporter permease LptG [Desulfobacterales bacterium]
MTIIYKYITIQISKYFGIVMAFVVGIYLAVDFFEKVDDFMEAGIPVLKMLLFFTLEIPFVVAQILPICILMSVLIVFSLMARNNEIVALKSSGIRILYLFKPVFIMGCIASVILFILSDSVVPITMAKFNEIWLKEVRKESTMITKEKNIWIKGNRRITNIKFFNPKSKVIYGVTDYEFDKNFRLVRRIDAEDGVFEKGKWLLHGLMEQDLDAKKGKYDITFHKNKVENLNFMPEDLNRVAKESDEMTLGELLSYIQKIEREGYDATVYQVDLDAKIAFPFICIIMCMIGTGLSTRGKMKEGMPVVIAYGIGTAFIYWIFYSFCLSLGYGEMLPPAVAAWTANVAFFCFGALTLLNAD